MTDAISVGLSGTRRPQRLPDAIPMDLRSLMRSSVSRTKVSVPEVAQTAHAVLVGHGMTLLLKILSLPSADANRNQPGTHEVVT